jgi:hypothetical protein
MTAIVQWSDHEAWVCAQVVARGARKRYYYPLCDDKIFARTRILLRVLLLGLRDLLAQRAQTLGGGNQVLVGAIDLCGGGGKGHISGKVKQRSQWAR